MISKKIEEKMKNASWIRAMFEEGEKLKKIHGAENVYDFTLGNPSPEPPDSVREIITSLVCEKNSNIHKYMNNAGFEDVRSAIAAFINKKDDLSLSSKNIIMTVGAAGALNVIMKAILNQGDEVIILAPYFVEYLFYIDNHGGTPVIVKNTPETFEPDIAAIEKNITPKTKAIIINSPNNPTGVIYSEASLKNLASMLNRKQEETGQTIYIISDEPYREIVYDNTPVPNLLTLYKNSLVAYSYSKSLSLAGERIGYIVVNNSIENIDMLISALCFCNRILGFVNAPSLFQRVIKELLGSTVDVLHYKEKRDYLYSELTKIGYICPKPEGAFYLFPKAPSGDDIAFVKKGIDYNLLLVPGSGFGCPGYFRISYCVDMTTIKNSIESFKKLFENYN